MSSDAEILLACIAALAAIIFLWPMLSYCYERHTGLHDN